MKKQMRYVLTLFAAVVFAMGFSSCSHNEDSPYLEYMPDMYRSPAIEAYVDYGMDPWMICEDSAAKFRTKISAKMPVEGTIPFISDTKKAKIMMPYKRKPWAGADVQYGMYGAETSSTDYQESAQDQNPIRYSDEVLKEGKVLYNRFCSHCHGEKGDGKGQIVKNGKLSGVPSYTDGGRVQNMQMGQIFYVVTYGKNLMGPHASQINKEERWKLTHYVKALQNGGKYPESAKLSKAQSAQELLASEATDNGGTAVSSEKKKRTIIQRVVDGVEKVLEKDKE